MRVNEWLDRVELQLMGVERPGREVGLLVGLLALVTAASIFAGLVAR
jgi:hypothetical protein